MFWGDLLAGIFSADAAVGIVHCSECGIFPLAGTCGQAQLMESYAGSSVCIKNAIFSKKNTKTGDFAMQKAVIFAERAK